MRPVTSRRRSRYVLLVLTLVAVTLITLDARGFGVFDSVRSGSDDVLGPVADGIGWVTTPFRNAWNGVTGYDDLESRNRELQAKLDELETSKLAEQNAQEQLKRLNEQLNIGFAGNIPTQIARVSSGPFSNFADYRLEIDKGSDAGLEVGMPVVANSSGGSGGLVGRLSRVSKSRSVVQLASDPDFILGVRVASSQDLGVGHGGGETNRFIVDRQIDLNDPVQPGDAVLTSGLSNSVMPPDIPIGVVDKVTPDVDTQVKLLQVRFAVDFSQLDVVQVLKWKPAS